MSKGKVYAIYKGDKFIDVGTVKELAERLRNKRRNDKVYELVLLFKKE